MFLFGRFQAYPWVGKLLTEPIRSGLFRCCRFGGKDAAAVSVVLRFARENPGSRILFFERTMSAHWNRLIDIPRGVVLACARTNEFGFGGFDLVVVNDGAGFPAEFSPPSAGLMVAFSTPSKKPNWFDRVWASDLSIERTTITANDVPGFSSDFLQSATRELGRPEARREYYCEV